MNNKDNRYLVILVGLGVLLSGCSSLESVNQNPEVKPRPQTGSVSSPVNQPVEQAPPKVTVKPYSENQGQVTVPVPPPVEPELAKNPYDDMPQVANPSGAALVTGAEKATSPAVISLIAQANTDIANNDYSEASSKLERALRIDPRNAEIWHLLAKSSFDRAQYSSSISMAKKSNLYTDSGSSLEKKNWQLIKEASKKSGDINTLKQAILYERANP